jgi:hypothetical protein
VATTCFTILPSGDAVLGVLLCALAGSTLLLLVITFGTGMRGEDEAVYVQVCLFACGGGKGEGEVLPMQPYLLAV